MNAVIGFAQVLQANGSATLRKGAVTHSQ